MTLSDRIAAAWRALKGQRDPYAATYGSSSSGFAGAAVNRLTASMANWSGSVNADLDGALPILRARARALAANNEHGKRFLSLVAANVVGRRNPKLQVRALTPGNRLDKSANDAVEFHWERWGRSADISGRHKSLYSLLRTTIKGVARDGEAIIRLVRNRSLPYGIGLQLLEADRLDDTINARLSDGNVIRQGIELDSALRVVAYYVKTAHPGDNVMVVGKNVVERVPAGDMVHLFLPERAEQVRGITWLHAVIMRGGIIHRFEEAAVVAAEIGASKVAALQRPEEAPDLAATMADAQVGNAMQINVQAGELFELPPGYTLNGWNPEYPHANFDSFLKACLRGLAAGLDVAAHNLTGDMTDVNYSSARIAELAEREAWMVLQDWLIESFLMPLYEEWLALSLLAGKITFEQSGKALPADKFDKFRNASRFQGRRWAWVDPAKEAEANEKLLANKLTSRTRIAAEQGEEFEDILDELAAEQTAIDDAGLGAPKPPPEPKQPAPEDDPAAKAITALQAEVRSLAQREPAPQQIHVAPVIHLPETRVDNHIAAPEAPVVNVTNEITEREQAAPVVQVSVEAVMPEQPAPQVDVHVEAVMPSEMKTAITALPDRRTTTEIVRNGAGEIVESVQHERDA